MIIGFVSSDGLVFSLKNLQVYTGSSILLYTLL